MKPEKEYRKDQFLPINKWHNNFTYTAPPSMKNCNDLQVTKLDGRILSTWKMNSIFERIKFLFKGEIILEVSGDSFSPTAIYFHDGIKR